MLKILEKIIRKKAKRIEFRPLEAETMGLKNSLVNRPLEGEIVNIKNIKIPQKFTKPKKSKMKARREYFKKHGYFRSTVILNSKNCLIDGYTTYLLAKEAGFSYITILREN